MRKSPTDYQNKLRRNGREAVGRGTDSSGKGGERGEGGKKSDHPAQTPPYLKKKMQFRMKA